MKIDINDTHRLPYSRAKLTAIKLGAGATQPVKFFDFDGSELGYTVYTNSQGFICDGNGNLLGNGVFVHEDAVINCVYNGGQISQWAVRSQVSDSELQINDGKLRNKDGDVVWSANSRQDYTLKYSDIEGTPRLNEWSEDEQDILIPRGVNPSLVEVGKHTKILVVGSELEDASFTNVGLTPEPGDPQRFGQVVFVVNGIQTDTILQLANPGDTAPICKIKKGGTALVALTSDGRFVALSQGGDATGSNLDIAVALIGNEYPVTDDTPGIVYVRDTPTSYSDQFAKFAIMASAITKPRRLIVIWQPLDGNGNRQKRLKVFGSAAEMTLGTYPQMILQPFCPCELVLTFGVQATQTTITPLGCVEPRNVPIVAEVPTALINGGVPEAYLPSGATVIDLKLTGGTNPNPANKVVFPVLVNVAPNFEGDITVMNSNKLEIENFEIHIGFRCGQYRLMAKLAPGYNSSLQNDQMTKAYRSYESHGGNKGKFFVTCHVIAMSEGGMYACMNPDTSDT